MNLDEIDKKSIKKMMKKTKKKIVPVIFIILLILVFILGMCLYSKRPKKQAPQIITKSTLEKIIDKSDISTFETIYNGVVKKYNAKKTDKIDYYVSYDSTIRAGFDLEEVTVDVNDEDKTVTITLPDIKITDINVKYDSMDFIFYNNKLNDNDVSAEAYKECINDVKEKAQKQDMLFDLAEQNAHNIIEGLIEPFVEQLGDDYQLVIE